ncbi:hypothetical protein [Haloplanus halophilus]|uniref:hypothetical protein n=1 Tax=Haloplanus halophilus TaxID=2949993 RepID=UPI00203BD0C3|nr:hypothetical protein [Haloplanus sp. GDY1]
MSQATLSDRPYVNANLFSGHYLDERVQERDEWDCDDDAREAMDDLQTLYELEGSLVDRLETITLPDPNDVADDLERYREAVERATELDEKIQRTDDLIDEIVYDLYGLTDEEIEIVEEAVADD